MTDPRQRIPTAYHEAGHAVMAYWFGHRLSNAGVRISADGGLVAGSAGRATTQRPPEGSPKEQVMIALAGHLAAHRWMLTSFGEGQAREWRERGGPGPLTKDEFLQAYFQACTDVNENREVREDWCRAAIMVGGELDTGGSERSLNRFKARCVRYQSETLDQLANPLVWCSVCKLADGLLAKNSLSDAECKLTLGDDFDALDGGYYRKLR